MPKRDEDFVPAAVKKQEDAAKAAQAAEIEKKKPVKKKKAPAKKEAPAATETPGFDAAAAVPDDPNAAPIEAPAPEAQPAAADGEDYKQKFLTLQGMYNKDTHELKTALDAVQGQVAGQQSVIDNLNNVLEALPKQAAQAAPEVAPAPSNPLRIEDFGGYGEEMRDLLAVLNNAVQRIIILEQKVAKGPSNPPAANDNLTKRLDRIEETQVMTVKDRFYKDLNDAVPGWGKQNHDPKFHLWLDEIDPMSNVKRSALLKFAFDRFNSQQVISIFKGFLPPAAPNASTEDTLEAQVVPETTGNEGDNPGGMAEKTYATLEEYKAAQKAFIDGKITEAEQDKIANSYQAGLYAKK
jgi:hypothetical protein